jgi:DNA topoisomerase-6 subunit B
VVGTTSNSKEMVEEGIDRIAEKLSRDQREVSVSEFFEKNRHLLGYDNPTRALLTVVKELVDNSLDAAEEARILPRIWVEIKPNGPDRYKVTVKDNGPGMTDKQIPLALGKLLYGSKFFRLRQSRGTQGIGASGAILYSQLTTGKPTTIIASIGNGKTSYYELMIDVKKNEPEIVSHQVINDGRIWHGMKIEMEIEGRYVESRKSVPEYIKQVAIANPYAHIIFNGPNGKMEFPRAANELPPLPKEIMPHPHGVELGILRRMLKATRSRTVASFLMNDFSRVGAGTAKEPQKKYANWLESTQG